MKIIIICLLLLSACEYNGEVSEPIIISTDGKFTVVNYEQDYYEGLDEYSMVTVNFKVVNLGGVDIDYYEVWFQVDCVDGSFYQDWTNGMNVSIGREIYDYTYIDTFGEQAISVSIIDTEIESYQEK